MLDRNNCKQYQMLNFPKRSLKLQTITELSVQFNVSYITKVTYIMTTKQISLEKQFIFKL